MVKDLPANTGDARDVGLIPGWARAPEGGNGHPLEYSCLEKISWTEEASKASSSLGFKESETTERCRKAYDTANLRQEHLHASSVGILGGR